MLLQEMIDYFEELGYRPQDARARVCQDIILKAISSSTLCRNVTIKGGVVIRSISSNARRTTQDMDIDFIRYSLSDNHIDDFISNINCLPGISIERTGIISELNQQDYRGKSTHVIIRDQEGTTIESKLDLGVHTHFEIEQDEYCFDIAFDDEGASLLINTKEQMFTEKLRSLLKFGRFSTRYKDIFDMYYFCDRLNIKSLKSCLESYVLYDTTMRENNMSDIINRLTSIFQIDDYRSKVDNSDKRWLDDDIDIIFHKIVSYLQSI